MEQYKFAIESEEHSNRLQNQLFQLGYYWSAGGETQVQHVGAPYIFANKDNTITFVSSSQGSYFKKHKADEAILAHPSQLKFLEKLIDGRISNNLTILFVLASKFYLKRDREYLNGLLKNSR